MSTLYSIRWLSPAPAEGPRRARWSVWHATDDGDRTLCGRPIRDRVNRGERTIGTALVECSACRRALARRAA